MNTAKFVKSNHPSIYLLSLLLLVLVSCQPLASAPAAETKPTAKPTETGIQFFLTADQLPVSITHGSDPAITLTKGQTVGVSINDKIAVGDGGIGKLVYSDRVVVEIWTGTEIVMSAVTTVAGDRLEVSLVQNFGTIHVTIGENAKAGVVLKTNDSTITSLTDDTEFSVCYAPGKDGLTCHPVLKGSIQVFGKTGKSQVYNAPPAVGAYTFNGKAPEAPICFHDQEYKDWQNQIRSGQKAEVLGVMVDRWYHEPCPGEAAAQQPTATQMAMESSTPEAMTTPTEMAMGASTPQVTATQMAMGSSPTYFTEEFNAGLDLSQWPSFQWNNLTAGNFQPQDVATTIKDGFLIFDLPKPHLSSFVTYSPSNYGDVKISINAHNSGENSSSVSLICHQSAEGWYEFKIENDGLYSIMGYMAVEKKYYTIVNGGSNSIHTGMGENEFSATCKGNELSLSINGKVVNTVKDNMHVFGEGKVGVGVSSTDAAPILEEVNWFKVEKP